jgi:predicted class III extradiol MEMO1 family dioxygenase
MTDQTPPPPPPPGPGPEPGPGAGGTPGQPQQTPPPPFDPGKPHHAKPKLRRLQPFPVKVQDQTAMGLRDASQISNRVVVTAPIAQFILPHMDGSASVDTIVDKAAAQAKQSNVPDQAVAQIKPEPVQQLISQLDDAGLLEGPRFEELVEQMQREFDQTDILPPAVTADFADALVKQQEAQAQGLTDADAQKVQVDDATLKQRGPAAMREHFDKFIDKALEQADDPALDALPKAVFVPHSDYARAWPIYASAYGRMRVVDAPDRVVVLGVNHFGRGTGVVGCDKGMASPLGSSPADTAFIDSVKANLGDQADALFEHKYDHEREFSIEMQMPWIHHVFGGGDKAGEEGESAAPKLAAFLVHDPLRNNGESYDGQGLALEPFIAALKAAIDAAPGTTLVIASAELSHMGPAYGDRVQQLTGDSLEAKQLRESMVQTDRQLLELVREGKPDELMTTMQWQQNATRWSGTGPIVAALKATGVSEVKLLQYAASADQQGMTLVSGFAGVG